MTAFEKVLIANRGEIAVRIARSAQAQGYRTVAVHSSADAGAPHVRAADEAVEIGPPPATESYLAIDAILAAAKSTGADAVHPGYGFLAENPDFATACRDAGLVFIGPDPEAIRLMGNKRAAKARLAEAGVVAVPGHHGTDQSDDALIAAAREIGAPLMVKAAAGGGGRGLRRVDDLDVLAVALATARSEATNAFGNDELILEKALTEPRHVEVQVFGDRHGNVIHLGERDCSIQRRHQKVIEEAPSPAVDAELRAAMGAAAVAAAKAIDYLGAGTVEFLLDSDGVFYFLEMNTRLQVEHPVTEMITGLDLVAWQLAVAAGEPLPLRQDEVTFRGHAIEARLYAEDAYGGFLPQSGRILSWQPADGPGLRVDHGIESGFEVSPHYDPLLAKLIAHGESREVARRRLARAVDDSVLLGIASNKHFLGAALRHPDFAAGEATTAFIERAQEAGELGAPGAGTAFKALAAVLLAEHGVEDLDSWSSTGTLAWPLRLVHGAGEIDTSVSWRREGYRVDIDDAEAEIRIIEKSGDRVRFRCDGVEHAARFGTEDDALWLDWGGQVERFAERRLGESGGDGDKGDGRLLAPMDGRIVAVMASERESVEAGQCVVVLEAMKMQHEIRAGRAGTVDRVAVAEGDQVAARQVLVELAPEEAAGD
jgi:geranyl-CoA carboxylase alpha subunit